LVCHREELVDLLLVLHRGVGHLGAAAMVQYR
jgi:hypothetical protein